MAPPSEGYVLGERLHAGGHSTVYRAVRAADGRAIILKVLNPRHASAGDVARLRNELELGPALHGLAVVEPLALSTLDGLPALELEDFPGVPLSRRVGRPMAVEDFLRLAVSLAGAVADLHGRGVIHKDLKPGNVLYDPLSGQLRLCDFGLATRLTQEQATARPARLIEGTLPYVSPEQTGRMNRALDSRSDLYSLGVTLYELLTGQLPFTASDAMGWVHAHLARRPPPPAERLPGVPGVLSDLLLKLLAKEPEARYQSAAGLLHDLQRCLDEWVALGHLAPFPLGERDASERFLIPQRLYGRDAERAELLAAFERVAASGRAELVLVSGYSGIGKSSVIHELHRPVVARHGLFVAGKFEQHRREVPYFTLTRSFRELTLDLLAESEEQVAAWRGRLTSALGQNGQLVVELIPQVELILGPQPAVPALGLGEAELRLRRVLCQFLGAFATAEHPLTLFLDDLQWADAASLELLVELVRSPESRHLLLVGAYRDNEVGPAHRLARTLEELRQAGAPVRSLVLGPLSEADLGQLVADAVHAPPEEAAPLAHLVQEKSGGNPFFTIQLLTALHRQGLLCLDRAAGRWRWDLPRIQAQGYSDNVAELMLGKLRHLPAEAQQALRLAACLGASVDAATLALVLQRDPGPALASAVAEDLLLHFDRTYRFPHDRVQEAAYALIPERERAGVHLEIGRRLAAQASPARLEEGLFEAVGQLNRGAALITATEERERVAELNLAAGRRAQRSTAYASALKYLAVGAALLPPDSWERRYELAFALEFHRAECEVLTSELEAAEARLASLSRRARDPVDTAEVARTQVGLYIRKDRPDLAIRVGLQYLRRAGIDWSPHPTPGEARRALEQLLERLAGRPIEELRDLPQVAEPRWQAVLDLLTELVPAAIFTDENLLCLLIGHTASLNREHGNNEAACFTYAWLGALLGPHFGDYPAGFRFGQLALELVESRRQLRYKARALLTFGDGIVPWNRHVRMGVEYLRRAFETAQETGDLAFASYARNLLTVLLLVAGFPLDEVQREVETSLAIVRKVRFAMVVDEIAIQLQFVRMLRGLTPQFGSFQEPQFDEGQFERRVEAEPRLAIVTCAYWVRRLQARFFAGAYAEALAASARAQPHLWTSTVLPESAEYHFYSALALAAHHDQAPAGERPKLLRALAAHHRQLEVWAGSCPATFRSRAALVGAEQARLAGRAVEAEELYERALRAAREGGFVQDEALTCEAAARFYRGRGLQLVADTYLRAARDCYQRWGADGKVRQLEQLHPHLTERESGPDSLALRPEQLDLLAVVKATQTISGVMERERLLRTLLQIVLEQGGARRARLVLLRGERLETAAEASVEEGPPGPRAGVGLPESVLQYVQRTGERVLLDDAAASASRFSGDPYFLRARPRSVLCLPIRRQAEVVALLYLENELATGAFTRERLLALELLAGQAAISLENTLLLERERAEREAAQAERQRALLLGEATALISSTPDYEGVFEALARLCARSFADWAVIDLLEAGRTVRLAGAHRDPAKEPLLRELAERYPARIGTTAPATRVLQSWEPLLLEALTDEQIRAMCVDDRHAELIHLLGTRSGVVVPLVARGVQLGALTLTAAQPHRFAPADVALAQELGRRVALAIENARLLRLREDFVSVASHELRTPVTALRLAVDLLLRGASAPGGRDRLLRRIRQKTERLEQLTTELLEVSRAGYGRMALHPAEVELGALVRRVLDRLELDLAAAHCPVELSCPAPVRGRWDAERLEQVVTGLLTNALKFGAGQPIEIRVSQAGGQALLSVRDHGLGIDPGRQAQVFDRFERAVPATRYGGLGLGLFLARTIVQAHGGTIGLESQPGQGATFIVELPCDGPAAEAPASQP